MFQFIESQEPGVDEEDSVRLLSHPVGSQIESQIFLLHLNWCAINYHLYLDKKSILSVYRIVQCTQKERVLEFCLQLVYFSFKKEFKNM